MPYSVQKGFTLIETMVAVSVMVMIGGMSIMGAVSFNQRQGSEDDAKVLVSEIRRIYSRATGIYYPSGCIGRLTGYSVSLENGMNDIKVTANCNNLVDEIRADVLKTSHFSGDVIFTINAGDGRVSGSPYTITIISDSNASLTKQVRVSDFGVLEIL